MPTAQIRASFKATGAKLEQSRNNNLGSLSIFDLANDNRITER
jgi:hypothetical protein